MRVTWLNDDCTEAQLVRGVLFKRAAIVRKAEYGWQYDSGDQVDDLLAERLTYWRDQQRHGGREVGRRNWHPVRKPPAARLLKE